ncbi:MAG: hypothetical protein HY537_02340 [Deltaproteobacteria bacterium]|nr:hypothetical protein [Deltaproteobacteria bacterium]
MEHLFNLLLALALSMGAIAFGKPSCEDLDISIDRSLAMLNESLRLQDELKTKFEHYIEQDFVDQSEGLISQINRSAASKVAFAKKKLARLIENQDKTLADLKGQFCNHCSSNTTVQDFRQRFCARCPDHTVCWPKH